MKKFVNKIKDLYQRYRQQQKEKSKNFKKPLIIAIVIILICGAFIAGLQIGQKSQVYTVPIEGIKNADLNKPEGVDFSLFWDAWRYVQAYFLKSEKLNPQEMVYGAIKGMVDSLGDPYTVFFKPDDAKKFTEDVSGSFGGVGIEIGKRDNFLVVISPLEDTPAWKAGIKAGDKILAINDEATDSLSVDEAVKKIRGEKGTSVTLKIMRDGFDQPKDFTIVRDIINIPAVKINFLENNIAHLKLLSFTENVSFEFYRAATQIIMKNSPGIILDLRNNPGGYLDKAVEIAGWFVKRGDVVVRERERDNREQVFKATGNQMFINMPVVILVNEGSASAAEILAGALRDLRGIKLVGVKTFGKGSVQTLLPLTDNSMVKITIAEWLTPDGHQINEKGLEPDYEVKNDENASPESEKDLQLEKALEVIKSLINK
ncbi:MAG: S41 family peptidase [Minisyncoccia bacterium]